MAVRHITLYYISNQRSELFCNHLQVSTINMTKRNPFRM